MELLSVTIEIAHYISLQYAAPFIKIRLPFI